MFDVQTGQSVVRFRADETGISPIYSLTSHPTLPLTVTGHRDKYLRYHDTQSGEEIAQFL